MLAVTPHPHRRPVRLRHPEWKPIVTAYIGMLLMGGCFISVACHFEPDEEIRSPPSC